MESIDSRSPGSGFLNQVRRNLQMGEARNNRQISRVYSQAIDSTAEFYAEALVPGCICELADAKLYETAAKAAIGVCSVFAERVAEPKRGMIANVSDDADTR